MFSTGLAKKPKKQKLTEEYIEAKLDSIRQEYKKDSVVKALLLEIYDRWDRPHKSVKYYCLIDYLYRDRFDSDEKNMYIQLEVEAVKFRFKLLELCPNYIEDSDQKDAIVAYTMHEKETDSIVCRQKAVNMAIHNIFDVVQHRLLLLDVGELYLKPNDSTEEITCDNLWKADLIKVPGIPQEIMELYHTRQSAEQVDSLIRANALVCDTTIKIENEYRCFTVAKMPILPFEEWLEALIEASEEKDTWRIVLHELLYNPTNDSRVVVGRVHYAL